MLSNAYFLAKFRFDTAENEPAKNFPKTPPREGPLLDARETLAVRETLAPGGRGGRQPTVARSRLKL